MQKHSQWQLATNLLSLGGVQVLNFLLPLAIMPFVVSRIGADGFGIVSVAQVVMVIFAAFVDYSFNLTATREVALHKDSRDLISSKFYVVLVSKLILCVFSFLILIILCNTVPVIQRYSDVYLAGFTYVIGQALTVSWFFQGMEKMQYVALITFFGRILFVALVLFVIETKGDAIYYLLFLGLGNIFAGITSIVISVNKFGVRLVWPKFSEVFGELRDGWKLTLANLSINASQYLNIFLLRIFTNDLVAGYYGIAERLYMAVRQLMGIFSQVIYPQVCRLTLRAEHDIRSFLKRVYVPFFAAIVVGCITLFAFAPMILSLFGESVPSESVLLLRLLSIVPPVVCLNMPAYLLLLGYNVRRNFLRILGTGAIINILSNLLLIPNFEAIGTIFSILITELYITIALNIEFARTGKWSKVKFPNHE